MKTEYLKALGFNPEMFSQTLQEMLEVMKHSKSLLLK
jgi:hypothetical protein